MKLFVETDADSRLAKRVLKVRKSSQFIRLQNLSSMCVRYVSTMSAYLNTSVRYLFGWQAAFTGGQAVLRIRDIYLIFFHPGSQMQGTRSRIPDPGNKIPDPGSGSASKNLSIFNPKKADTKFSKIRSECSSRIPDPGSGVVPSRIPDLGVKIAPGPGS